MREEDLYNFDKEKMLWLSLDKEGLEILKEKYGAKFVEKYQHQIEREEKIHKKIIRKSLPPVKCPEEVFSKVKEQILNKSRKHNPQGILIRVRNFLKVKPEPLFLTTCILIIVMAISITIQTHRVKNLKRDNTFLKEKMALLESTVEKTSGAISDETPELYGDIIFSSFTEEQKIHNPTDIQNLLLNKTKTISVDINALQNSFQNIQITGYREDQLENEFIIQIGFQSDDLSYKVVVSPCSNKTADIYKSAILRGKVRDVRVIDNHIIGLIGEPGTPHSVLDYFSTSPSPVLTSLGEQTSNVLQQNIDPVNNLEEITPTPLTNSVSEEVTTSNIYQQDYESIEEKVAEPLPSST